MMLNPSEFDFEKCPYMSPLQKHKLKALFEKNIEKIRIVPKPPILLRSFATDFKFPLKTVYLDMMNFMVILMNLIQSLKIKT